MESTAGHRRERSGRGATHHAVDQHDMLRMELLLFEWPESTNQMPAQIASTSSTVCLSDDLCSMRSGMMLTSAM